MEKYSLTRVESAKWGLLALVVLLDVAVVALTPIQVSGTSTVITPAILMVVLFTSIAAYYHYFRDEPHFTHTLTCCVQFGLFTMFGCLMSYFAVALKFPLQDANLIRYDRMIGVHVEDIVAWVQQYPLLNGFLFNVYFSLLWQFLFVFAYLGIIRGAQERLDEFVLLVMITSFLTAIVAAFLPAAGPCHEFGMPLTGMQEHYFEALTAIRGSAEPVITMNDLDGMLTFPSYHTVLACILIHVFRTDKFTFPFIFTLNVIMIFSTITHGCHYLMDIIAGLLVFAASVMTYHFCFHRSPSE